MQLKDLYTKFSFIVRVRYRLTQLCVYSWAMSHGTDKQRMKGFLIVAASHTILMQHSMHITGCRTHK